MATPPESEKQSPPLVTWQIEGGIATLLIENPPVNALSRDVMVALDQAFQTLSQEQEVRVILVTGAGTVFVAGADVRELARIQTAPEGQEASAQGQRVFQQIAACPKPVIAVINGACLGGGLELALACHLRLAGERARLGLPEIGLGIIPGWGGTQRLPRLVGEARALEMILTGEPLSAREAFQIGLVNRVFPDDDLLRQARNLARRLAAQSPTAVRAALRAVREGRDLPLPEALSREAVLFGELCGTEDMREGVRAFLEKRRPQFS